MSKSKLDALKAVYQWVTRTMMKDQTGVMQTLPNRDLIELNTQITAQRLMQAGVDPTTLKNANQVENAINIIESRPVQEGIKSTKAGKVFDMEGQEIPQGSRIIGGKAVKETEEEIAARMSKENKEAAERIRKQKESKKILEDYETSEAELREKLKPKSTTSLDDEIKQAYDKAVKENKFKNVRLKDGRKIESEEDFREYIDELNEDSNFADGGRIGFKKGMDRRTFMKIMGGLTTLHILGKFFKGAEVAAPAVEKAVDVASEAPPYFFNLVDKIKTLGKKFGGPKERSESYVYKDYEMDIDLDTGKIDIKKTKEAMIPGGDEAGIAEEVYMTYKPGMADEATGGRKIVDEYDEFNARPDIDGKMKDVEDGVPDEVIEEGTVFEDNMTEFGKASGGIARMLGE